MKYDQQNCHKYPKVQTINNCVLLYDAFTNIGWEFSTKITWLFAPTDLFSLTYMINFFLWFIHTDFKDIFVKHKTIFRYTIKGFFTENLIYKLDNLQHSMRYLNLREKSVIKSLCTIYGVSIKQNKTKITT